MDTPKILLIICAIFYWIPTVLRLFPKHQFDKISGVIEKIGFVLLTISIVFYIYVLTNQGHIDFAFHLSTKKPLSWLLFAWSLNAANILTEIAYANHRTSLFSSAWTAMALSLLPNTSPQKIAAVFSNNLSWLHMHRICFLLGYGFCLLALPLAIQFLWKNHKHDKLSPEDSVLNERELWKIDRLQYLFILWALPLLTLGIVVEALFMLEQGQFPTPTELWHERKDAFLALATWFICGLYLHSRIFFGWRLQRTTAFYFIGLVIVVVGQFSANFLQYRQ